jgi:hypothetical protein
MSCQESRAACSPTTGQSPQKTSTTIRSRYCCPYLCCHRLHLEWPHPHRLLQTHAHTHRALANVAALSHASQHQPTARMVVALQQTVLQSYNSEETPSMFSMMCCIQRLKSSEHQQQTDESAHQPTASIVITLQQTVLQIPVHGHTTIVSTNMFTHSSQTLSSISS